MELIKLNTGEIEFEATLLRVEKPIRTVLFAVGGGGNPKRHEQLLTTLFKNKCTVIAPHFERLTSPKANREDLILRARKLQIALDYIANPSTPTVGIGHSIGATLLLALAGGKMWLSTKECLPIPYDERLKKLTLLTPPTGFFQAPNALDKIQISLQIWAGALDSVTPPAQAEFLKNNLVNQVPLDFRIIEDAGHFSFMNTLPPHIIDPMLNREIFLNTLAMEILQFFLT